MPIYLYIIGLMVESDYVIYAKSKKWSC